jgi:hypothetical protein
VPVELGQIRDNLARCRVVSGGPPKRKTPIKTGQIAPNCLERSRKKWLLTGGLLVRVQPEEPTRYASWLLVLSSCSVAVRFAHRERYRVQPTLAGVNNIEQFVCDAIYRCPERIIHRLRVNVQRHVRIRVSHQLRNNLARHTLIV